MKEKIAFVVQRYGIEVNGGAEFQCRLFAEHLTEYYDIEILTTKALDYMTWENHYKNDVDSINNVTVRRFNTSPIRDVKSFNKYSEYIFNPAINQTLYDELQWMYKQGPVCFDMIDYIKQHKNDYKAFVFFTYSYFTSYFGLQIVPEKSILIPEAHNEPSIYLSMYKPLFHLPRYILFNTKEEQNFVHKMMRNQYIPHDIAGIGIDMQKNSYNDEIFRKKYNVKGQYLLYIGRIDESKGCKEMIEYYLLMKKEYQVELPKLVLIGKQIMDIPKDKDIEALGFIEEDIKYSALSGATCLLMPSKYESLSMVVLEAFSLKKTVLVNGACEVLKGHCIRGNAGLYYENYEEFYNCVELLANNSNLKRNLGENGYRYVMDNYQWDKVIEKITFSIEEIDKVI